MSEVPVIIAEVTAADWSDAGTGWTHLPYLARFRADRLPLSWEGFFTGRHHAVLESGRSGSFTMRGGHEEGLRIPFLPSHQLGDCLRMAKGRGRAGTHTSLTDAARPVAEALERHGRVSRGVISARVRASTLSIKVMKLVGCLRITVVSKGSRQELHVYGITAERAGQILSGPDFSGYKLNFADE